MIEKTLTELLSPLGVVWLLLLALVYFSFINGQKWQAWIGFICWLILTIGGNSFVANWLTAKLEAPYSEVNPFQMERFQTLVVLGGGTSYRSIGHSQFDQGGDRVALAARLYHAGKADRIVCTGSNTYRANQKEPHAREQSAELLISLMVPADRIDLVEGENTSQEIKNLATYFQNPDNQARRIGLITSAAHLPRAIRLAGKHGLQFIPLPADVRGREYRPNPNVIVPGAESLGKTKAVIKEYLAYLVGR
jgi:uncharacterized SAM-binding protein YcdF (DUF218 family)